MIGSKAQAGVMDAMIFLLVASGAATLLIYIAGAYGVSANQQVIAIYNYEFAGNAIVALHYAKDADRNWFFDKIKERLTGKDARGTVVGPQAAVKGYLDNEAADVWGKLLDASPTKCVALSFSPEQATAFGKFEYPDQVTRTDCTVLDRPVYASSINVRDDDGEKWTLGIKLYY